MEPRTDVGHPGAELVWSRYNAMIVASTVGLGFLGQLASSQSDVKSYLAVAASLLGAAVCVLWWLITSYGWSLSCTAKRPHQPTTKRGWTTTGRRDVRTQSGGVPTS